MCGAFTESLASSTPVHLVVAYRDVLSTPLTPVYVVRPLVNMWVMARLYLLCHILSHRLQHLSNFNLLTPRFRPTPLEDRAVFPRSPSHLPERLRHPEVPKIDDRRVSSAPIVVKWTPMVCLTYSLARRSSQPSTKRERERLVLKHLLRPFNTESFFSPFMCARYFCLEDR
jgi:hypothetical protein